MDIDKMFKLPALPAGTGGAKRKLPDLPTADVLKRFRPDDSESNQSSLSEQGSRLLPKTPTVRDAEEEESQAEDVDGEDDEEGRFFGGGLNEAQNHILDIFDRSTEEDTETVAMTLPALRRMLGRFEKTVAKNSEQRGKYPDDPSKFIDSESDLDAMLKQFLPLTQNPAQFYPELVKSGSVGLLTNLLSHENTDIAIDVIEVIQELTDEDVGADENDVDSSGLEYDTSNTRLAIAQFIDELLSHSIFELLVSNLGRLDETEETDRQGVFQIFGVLENLLSFMPPLSGQVGASTTLLQWLINRMEREVYDSNQQYASEILSILLQGSRANVLRVAESGGLDSILTILSQYRKKDPRDSEEQEFMENTFDCLCSLLSQPECKQLFLEAEGVELMIIMMKEKLLARLRAIKVLDYACQTYAGAGNCERFVEMLGLKTFFSTFMGKGEGKKKRHMEITFEDDEHLLGILASLFSNLSSDTPPRIRLIAKFVELDYEKVDRLLELRESARTKLQSVDRQLSTERKIRENDDVEEIDDVDEDEWYLRRMEGGLSSLQSADYILAWICMEDDGAKAHAQQILSRTSSSLDDVRNVLIEFANHIDDDFESGVDVPGVDHQKMVIEQLVKYLSDAP